MKIAVDIRVLMDQQYSGISEYVHASAFLVEAALGT